METMGKSIEIVPCTIREQLKMRQYNIPNTFGLCPSISKSKQNAEINSYVIYLTII